MIDRPHREKTGVRMGRGVLGALRLPIAALVSFVSVYQAAEPFREDLARVHCTTASGAGQTT